jgi:hypothetical protein
MNNKLKNAISIIAGLVIGNIVNMAIIMVSKDVIPPPTGADVTTLEGLKASIHLFKPINFLMPFLAHAAGTFSGAYLAAKLAASFKSKIALSIGFIFLIGGVANIMMLPSPIWFSVLDLTIAYLPMSYIAGKLT